MMKGPSLILAPPPFMFEFGPGITRILRMDDSFFRALENQPVDWSNWSVLLTRPFDPYRNRYSLPKHVASGRASAARFLRGQRDDL